MKITIRTNPEIILEIDQDKTSAVLPITTGIYVPPTAPAREPKPDPEATSKLGATKGGKHKTRLCSNCNQPGHKKPTCPKDKKSSEEESPFDNNLADKIEGLKEEGFSAQYIADDLRLPLETVKRYY